MTANIDTLTREAQGLSEKRLGELIDYLLYLKNLDKADRLTAVVPEEDDELEPEQYRKPGHLKKAVFAPDFDDIPEGFEDYI